MTRWEYKTDFINAGTYDNPQTLMEHLNKLGKEGWELVLLTPEEGTDEQSESYMAILKRPKGNARTV